MKNLKTTILTIAFVTSSVFTLSANSAEANEYTSNEIMLSETSVDTNIDESNFLLKVEFFVIESTYKSWSFILFRWS